MTPTAVVRSRARSLARHAALDVLGLLDTATGSQRQDLTRPRVHFPYLHSVPAHEEERFRALLSDLRRTHEFIGYSDAVDRVLRGDIDRPYMAFSFDDGFASNTRTARILEEFDTRGCFFVATRFIGTPTVEKARELFGYSEGIDEPAMTWTDLESLLSRGHEIGNHTMRHRPLSHLPPDQVIEEIAGAAENLRGHLGQVDHFAWPFGRYSHFSPVARDAVFAAGHRSCASAERGSHVPDFSGSPSTLCLRRDHLMTRWPLAHSRRFLAKSAKHARAGDQGFPADWDVEQ